MTSGRGDRLRLALLFGASVLFHLTVIIAFNSVSQREYSERQRASYLFIEPVKLGGGDKTEPPAGQPVPSHTELQHKPVEGAMQRSARVPPDPVQRTSRDSVPISKGVDSRPASASGSSEQRASGAGSATAQGIVTGSAISVRSGQKEGEISGVPSDTKVTPTREADGASERRNTYQALLKRIIEKHKEYPLAARKLRREGSCQRRFVLGRNGALKTVEKLSSCGNAFLDDAATRAIVAVGVFPPLTEDFNGSEQAFTVTMTFALTRQ